MTAEIMPYSDDTVKVLMKCVNFAAIKHKDQRRKDELKTPYINHPIGVAYILTEEAGIKDLIVLQAALLHDTVEDTETTFDELDQQFGSEVTAVVREVTDDKALPKDVRKRLQVEHASHCSRSAKLVKLADKLYNLRDLSRSTPIGWTTSRVDEYFDWAAQVVDALRGTDDRLERALDAVFAEHRLRKNKRQTEPLE